MKNEKCSFKVCFAFLIQLKKFLYFCKDLFSFNLMFVGIFIFWLNKGSRTMLSEKKNINTYRIIDKKRKNTSL